MKFVIKNREEAAEYDPKEIATYVIRIQDVHPLFSLLPLKHKDKFLEVKHYSFHDAGNYANGEGPIEGSVAVAILNDFKDAKNRFPNLEAILIHCNEGQSRSPAVAAALNEVFDLGYKIWEVTIDHSESYNLEVYKQLVKVAKEIGLTK